MGVTGCGSYMRRASSAMWGAALLLAWHLVSGGAWAQVPDFWVADGVGNWNVGGNWSAGIPIASVDAQINNGGTARLFDPGAHGKSLTLGSGSANSGTLEVLGGQATFASSTIGQEGSGTLKITVGGSVSDSGSAIGNNYTGQGTATVDGGSWTSGQLIVGNNGTGTLKVLNHGHLDWTGSRSGTFSFLGLPTLGGTLTWDTSQLYTTGVISVVGPAAIPGDYNGNGIVDAADYTVWRDTLGSTDDLRANGDDIGGSAGVVDQADYLVWKTNFGAHSGSGAGATAAVPEPHSVLLLCIGLASTLAFMRFEPADRNHGFRSASSWSDSVAGQAELNWEG